MHRTLVWLGVAAAALVLAAPAFALKVHVRVESANATIWGAKEPLVTPVTGTIQPPGGDPVTVNSPTVFGALERASRRGDFFYHVLTTAFGPYVDQVGRRGGTASSGWVFKVNGVSALVGATDYVVKDGDSILWYYATFGPAGGPKTLVLKKQRKPRLCFTALAQDDLGATAPAKNVRFRLNGKGVRSVSGKLCPKGRVRSISVAKAGMIRSAALAGRRAR